MFAVAHVLIPMIVLDLIRDHMSKLKKGVLTNKYIFIAGVAGLIPDIDIPISILVFNDTSIHRTFTHSIWVPIGLILASLVLYYLKKANYSKFFLMCFIGVSFHILLDVVSSGYVTLFIPLNDTEYGLNPLPASQGVLVYSIIDAILLLGWLFHEEIHHKISDFF